jgi:serine/threonine protein kinase, bacterial
MFEQFGHYQLRELLGEGAQGEVYRSYDTKLGRLVALKRLPVEWTDNEHFVRRFSDECFIVAKLSHHHIVPINNYGEIDGRLYLDMRLISGGSLATRIRLRWPLSLHYIEVALSQLCSALSAAHAANLVHRDIKPRNVLLSRHDESDEGDEPHCYLADFGLAHDNAAEAPRLSATDHPVGTLLYMAPERFKCGAGPGDHLVDIYALGCMLHELLTGRPPFRGATREDVIRAHSEAPRPVPSDQRPELTKALDAVVARAMQIEPRRRHANAAEFAVDLRAAVAGQTTVRRSSRGSPGPSSGERVVGTHVPDLSGSGDIEPDPGGPEISRRRLVLTGAAIVAATGIAGVGFIRLWQPARPGSATYRDTVLANVNVGDAPFQVAVTPDCRYAYVTNYRSNSVSILDAGQNIVIRTISIGDGPSGVVATPNGEYVFVADNGSGLLSMIETSAQQTRATVTVGERPGALAVAPPLRVYVAHSGNAVSALEIANGSLSVQAMVTVGEAPSSIAVATNGDRVYVANEGSGSVSVITAGTGRVSATIPVDKGPSEVVVTPDGSLAYVLTRPAATDSVCVIETGTNRVLSRWPVPGYLRGMALAPGGDRLYLADYYGARLIVLDPTNGTVMNTVPVGQRPVAVAASLDGQRVFVVNGKSNSVTVIDTSPT